MRFVAALRAHHNYAAIRRELRALLRADNAARPDRLFASDFDRELVDRELLRHATLHNHSNLLELVHLLSAASR